MVDIHGIDDVNNDDFCKVPRTFDAKAQSRSRFPAFGSAKNDSARGDSRLVFDHDWAFLHGCDGQ